MKTSAILGGLLGAALALPAAAQADPGAFDPAQLQDITGSPELRAMYGAIRDRDTPINADWRQPGRPPLALSNIQVTRNLVILEDDDGALFENGFAGGIQGQANIQRVLREVYSVLDDEYDFITVVIDWSVNGAFAFYLPLSNDTRGIGYANLTDEEVFDQTPGSPLQGFIFMNNWRFYTGNQNPIGANLSKVVWLQEIGHRWGSFVTYDKGNGPIEDLLGRDRAHWSYFMHSENSALEGNDWNDNGDGSFSTFTNSSRMTFSNLDLYLMGVLPPEDVTPFYVIRNPETGNLRDARGGRINRASPPETDGVIKTIRGDRDDVSIDDIIRAEGERDPDLSRSQKTWRMASVFITRSADNLRDADVVRIEELIDEWEFLFEEATLDEMNLITALDGEEAPEDLPFGAECGSPSECDPAESTACLSVDDDTQICSRRCLADSECGDDFCCNDPNDTGDLFCYPKNGACDSESTPEPDTDPEPTPEPAAPIATVNPKKGGCQTSPGTPAPWTAVLLLLPLLALRRR